MLLYILIGCYILTLFHLLLFYVLIDPEKSINPYNSE